MTLSALEFGRVVGQGVRLVGAEPVAAVHLDCEQAPSIATVAITALPAPGPHAIDLAGLRVVEPSRADNGVAGHPR